MEVRMMMRFTMNHSGAKNQEKNMVQEKNDWNRLPCYLQIVSTIGIIFNVVGTLVFISWTTVVVSYNQFKSQQLI